MVIRLYLGMLERSLASSASRAKVRETISVVDRTIDGIRRIIAKLSPLVLQELGLVAAIRKEAKDLQKAQKIRTRVVITDEVGRFSTETETAVYRIVQEALHNIAKHAQATSASVSLARENGSIRLLIEDDGVGIFPKSNFRGNSFGLAGIKERVGMLGGEVRVVSFKGKGTRIEISVPATLATDSGSVANLDQNEPDFYSAPINGGEESDNHAQDQVPTHG
jgi:signal transduction histidine kinase